MAQKRMFSKTITNSSRFLMMPSSTGYLYFQLGMNADDDGFCEHFAIMRMTESKPDDLKILQAKGFVEIFDDKVLIIRDWSENNYIRSDRYTASKYLKTYKEEIKRLTIGIPKIDKRLTQVRLDKVRLDKISKEEREEKTTPSQEMKSFLEEEDYFNKTVELFGSTSNIFHELEKFKSYWSELNGTGKKQRWQLERTFELKRRINTWLKNAKKFSQDKKIKRPVEEGNRAELKKLGFEV